MAAIDAITNTITNAPLPALIEKMGLSIVQAQKALDENSIAMLAQLAESPVTIGTTESNLLELGFIPSFYAFAEASFEAKLDFTIAESDAFSIGASVGAEVEVKSVGMFAASFNVSHARKFDQEASGSSSMAARMVSLPPPDRLLGLLKKITPETTTPA